MWICCTYLFRVKFKFYYPIYGISQDVFHDNVKLEILFYVVQYLGNTGVSKTHGAGSTDDAVKNIIHDVSNCIM